MSPFKQAVIDAMRRLAEDERTVFVGQSVRYDGAAIFDTLDGVPMEKRIEMPVAEDFQMGYCTGLALMGKIPVCIFPRFDFLLLATNQLVNHLDKLPLFGWNPRVIVRTTVGQRFPLDAGPQHTQDHTIAFRNMLTRIPVFMVKTAHQVQEAYADALERRGPTLIVEKPW